MSWFGNCQASTSTYANGARAETKFVFRPLTPPSYTQPITLKFCVKPLCNFFTPQQLLSAFDSCYKLLKAFNLSQSLVQPQVIKEKVIIDPIK